VELILEVFTGTKELHDFENELRQTHQRYEKLFDEVPCHVTVLDHKFRVTAINRKFKEEFGDFTGKNFFDVFQQSRTPYFPVPSPVLGRMANPIIPRWSSPLPTGTFKIIWPGLHR
jgi:PAS domain-containing protein